MSEMLPAGPDGPTGPLGPLGPAGPSGPAGPCGPGGGTAGCKICRTVPFDRVRAASASETPATGTMLGTRDCGTVRAQVTAKLSIAPGRSPLATAVIASG